jgi:hypothetical protein
LLDDPLPIRVPGGCTAAGPHWQRRVEGLRGHADRRNVALLKLDIAQLGHAEDRPYRARRAVPTALER